MAAVIKVWEDVVGLWHLLTASGENRPLPAVLGKRAGVLEPGTPAVKTRSPELDV